MVAISDALHGSDRPSLTARATLVMRALELDRPAERRIVSDDYAPYFLSALGRRALTPARLAAPVRHALERTPLLGLTTAVLCRHAFIDAHLLGALEHTEQVIVLGAGYDSRAYRFAKELAGRKVFEVDLAPLSRAKAAVVAAAPSVFTAEPIHRVEINFRTQSLRDQLLAAGFDPKPPTMVIWEGVVPYLTREAVEQTLADLAAVCSSGSLVTMDIWHPLAAGGLWSRLRNSAERGLDAIGEKVELMVPTEDIPDLLAPHGFEPVDLVESQQADQRYGTDGRRSDPGITLVAARLV